MSEHLADVVAYVSGEDESELAKTKAELGYALHCLEREIAICSRTHAGFLAYLQVSNGCDQTGEACREWQKCGCYQEAETYINGPVGEVKQP